MFISPVELALAALDPRAIPNTALANADIVIFPVAP